MAERPPLVRRAWIWDYCIYWCNRLSKGSSTFFGICVCKIWFKGSCKWVGKKYGPKGVHVSHVIIDGGINGDVIRNKAPERIKSAGENGMLNPMCYCRNLLAITSSTSIGVEF